MKNTIITILCFAALLMLGGFVSVKMMAKLDDEADRVASLEGRVEDLNGINYELNNEIASLTDALDQRDADLHTITDAIKGLQEPTTEEEKEETTEEDSNESALESDYDGDGLVFSATKGDGATSSKVPIQEPEEKDFDVYYADEPPADNSSSSNMTYLGTYTLTAYPETGSPCADGVYPSVGYTIACNDPMLWHRWVYIEGWGEYYCHDTGGMSSYSIIDIYMGDYDTCIQFGVRSANVYLIN